MFSPSQLKLFRKTYSISKNIKGWHCFKSLFDKKGKLVEDVDEKIDQITKKRYGALYETLSYSQSDFEDSNHQINYTKVDYLTQILVLLKLFDTLAVESDMPERVDDMTDENKIDYMMWNTDATDIWRKLMVSHNTADILRMHNDHELVDHMYNLIVNVFKIKPRDDIYGKKQ